MSQSASPCQCGAVLRFCPCCGRPMQQLGGRPTAAAYHPSARVPKRARGQSPEPQQQSSLTLAPTAGADAATALDDAAALAAFMQAHLPTAVSAFELFCLFKGCGDGAGVTGALGPPPPDRHRRAQQWLFASDAERAVYEAAAEEARHRAAVVAATAEECGREAARSAMVTDDLSPAVPVAQPHCDTVPIPATSLKDSQSLLLDTASAAAGAASATPATVMPTAPASACTPSGAPPRRRHLQTSLQVFRRVMRGKGPAAEINQAWKALTPEEKAPYDREAAAQRTMRYMDSGAAGPGSSQAG